jgi:hypothetical protein
MLVFAFGVRGSGSVTARRPLGTIALTLLGIWPLVMWVLQTALLPNSVTPTHSIMSTLFALGYVDSFLRFGAALVAVVQIARAGVVPPPWNWAPTWALAAVAAPWVFDQIIAVGAPQSLDLFTAFMPVDGLIRIGAPMFLGVLAIVLANLSARTRTVPIFRSSD